MCVFLSDDNTKLIFIARDSGSWMHYTHSFSYLQCVNRNKVWTSMRKIYKLCKKRNERITASAAKEDIEWLRAEYHKCCWWWWWWCKLLYDCNQSLIIELIAGCRLNNLLKSFFCCCGMACRDIYCNGENVIVFRYPCFVECRVIGCHFVFFGIACFIGKNGNQVVAVRSQDQWHIFSSYYNFVILEKIFAAR